MATDDHFYTTSAAERDTADANDGYHFEEIACYVYDSQQPGTVPLYRLYNGSDHFYTTSAAERDTADANDGYHFEEIACYVYDSQQPGTVPLYRLYNGSDHFYTTSAAERDTADANDGYHFEEIACYVYDSQQPGTVPLYRLYNGGTTPPPAGPIRVWIIKPLAINYVLQMTYGTSLSVASPDGTVHTIPSETLGLAVGPCPDKVLGAGLHMIQAQKSTGAVDPAMAQSMLDALKDSGNSDVSAVFVSNSQPGVAGPFFTINVDKPSDLAKILGLLTGLQALVVKVLANWTKVLSANLSGLSDLAKDSQYVVESLTAADLAASSVAFGSGAVAFIWPSTIGPEIWAKPEIPVGNPDWEASWTNPDGSVTMVGGDGVTITIGPPEIGTCEPDSGGGATWTPAPGDPGVDIGQPEAGDLGGDAGPGGGPGRPNIQ